MSGETWREHALRAFRAESPLNPWPHLLGPDHSYLEGTIRMTLTCAARIDPDAIQHALDKLDRLDTVGPIVDPTGWSKSHENARTTKSVLVALRGLTEALRKVGVTP